MFFLVLTCEDSGTEACLVTSLSSVVFTTRVPTLILDFIRSMITITNPIRQIKIATPRQIAEIRVGPHSELPT